MRDNGSGRIIVIVGLVIVVAAIVAVIWLSGGESRSVPSPSPSPTVSTATPTVSASTAHSTSEAADASSAVPESSTPEETPIATGESTPAPSQEFSLTPPTGGGEAVPTPTGLPDSEVAPIDPDASVLDQLGNQEAVRNAEQQLALDDLPQVVADWTSDEVEGLLVYTQSGGTMADTVTVQSLGSNSRGIGQWRAEMSGATDVGAGVCGMVGPTATCVVPSSSFGEVMLYGAEGVPVSAVRTVAEGVAAELR